MKSKKPIFASAVFFCLAVFYFLPFEVACKTAFPLAALFLFSIGELPWQIVAALFFSALGDSFSSKTHIVPKIIFFASAHVFYITFFINRIRKSNLFEGKMPKVVTAAFGAVFIAASALIAPHAPSAAITCLAVVYAGMLSTMVCTAVLNKKWMIDLGALLFLISDICLGWNLFVSPIPGEKYIVMVSYYLGQYLIYLCVALSSRKQLS